MDYAENYRKNLVHSGERILQQFNSRLNVGDYVVAKNLMNQLIQEELENFNQFEKEVKNGDSEFVGDIMNKDKVAYLIRGTLHIENLIERLLIIGKIPSNSNFNKKISNLRKSKLRAARLCDALDEIRKVRNSAAHEIGAGRITTVSEAKRIFSALDDESKSIFLEDWKEENALDADTLVKICLVLVLTALESEIMSMTWISRMSDVLLPKNAFRGF